MTPGSFTPPAPPGSQRRVPHFQQLQVGGRPFVLLPKADFDRLCRLAEGPRENASALVGDASGLDLRSRRHQVGLTLTAAAQKAGIRHETLSRIENGRTNPSLRTIRAILKALEQDPLP